MVSGYKAFNEDMTNCYGFSFSAGKVYITNGIIKFGLQGNGFHLCKHMEDTLRFYDGMNEKIKIAKVNGYGNIVKMDDEYYGYYDMYSVEKLEIERVLKRQEILDLAISLHPEALKRFISGFKLNNEEINFINERFGNNISVSKFIDYYQYGNKNAFYKVYK